MDGLLSITKRQKLEGQLYKSQENEALDENIISKENVNIANFSDVSISSQFLNNRDAFGFRYNDHNCAWVLILWHIFSSSRQCIVKPLQLNLDSEYGNENDLSKALFFNNLSVFGSEYVCCSPNGLIQVFTLDEPNHVLNRTSHQINLNDDGEFVTCVIHTGKDLFAFGTSFGNVIICCNNEHKRNMYSYILKRDKSLLSFVKSFIFKSFDDEHIENRSILQIFCISPKGQPNVDDVLLCVGSITTLWSNWMVPNEELFKDLNLKLLLVNDLNYVNASFSSFQIVKCDLIKDQKTCGNGHHFELDSTGTLRLCVLSTVSDAEGQTLLWLHIVELNSLNIEEACFVINNRVLVSCVANANPSTINIQISTTTDSKLYISWFDEATNDSSIPLKDSQSFNQIEDILGEYMYEHENLGKETLMKLLFIDADNLPLLSNPEHSVSVQLASSVGYFKHFDTMLPQSLVVSRAVDQMKYMVLLKNGSIISCQMKESARNALPKLRPMFITQETYDIADVQSEVRQLISELLKQADLHNFLLTKLRALMLKLSISTITDIITSISLQILTASTSGQHWNTYKSAGGDDGGIDLAGSCYQLVHREMESKLRAHSNLINLTFALELVDEREVRSGKDLTTSLGKELLGNHQCLLASFGLSSSVQTMYHNLVDKKSRNKGGKSDNISNLSATKTLLTESKTLQMKSKIFAKTSYDEFASTAAPTSHQHELNELMDSCHQRALRVINEGLEYTVRDIWLTESADYESKGLTAIDVFFSKISKFPDGFVGISQIIEKYYCNGEVSDTLNFDELLLTLSSCLLFFLSSIEQACEGIGSSHCLTSFISDIGDGDDNDRVRQCVLKVLLIFSGLVQKNNMLFNAKNNKSNLKSLFGESSTIGVKLKELSYYMLNSYVIEAKAMKIDPCNKNGVASTESSSTDDWMNRFQYTKEVCIDVLLCFGHLKTAFQFSVEFLYFKGIMESYKAAIEFEEEKLCNAQVVDISHFNFNNTTSHSLPSLIWSEIINLAQQSGNVYGTESVCLAKYIMTWLELNRMPSLILKLSAIAPNEFMDFIESRPHIAWIYHISRENFHLVSVSAVKHAKTQDDLKSAEILYSVAKLSSYINEKSNSYQNAEADDANTKALHELLVIESQNRIIKVKPNIVVDISKRIPLESLIDEYLNLAAETNQPPAVEAGGNNTDVLDYLYTALALINTGFSIMPANKK